MSSNQRGIRGLGEDSQSAAYGGRRSRRSRGATGENAAPDEIGGSTRSQTAGKVFAGARAAKGATKGASAKGASAKGASARGALDIFEASADIADAYIEFTSISEAAKTNIMLAEQDIGAIMASGKGEAARAENRGQSRGQDALLGAALQGQAIQGNLARSLQEEEELYGIMEGLELEIDALRQAHGVRQEIILIEGDVAAARRRRNSKVANGIFRIGLGAATMGG